MGISSSTNNGTNATQLQTDIRFLGDRFPFGDEELVLVYRAYQRLIESNSKPASGHESSGGDVDLQEMNAQPQRQETGVSFLADIALLALEEQLKRQQKMRPSQRAASTSMEFSSVNPVQQQLEERKILLEAVERKILPPGFGNTLYRQCFLGPNDKSDYDKVSEGTASSAENPVMDDYTRMARLEKFFEGLSDATRRGSKASILCLFRCCTPCDPPSKQNEANLEVPPAFDPNDFAYNTTQGSGGASQATKTFIRPLEFVTLGYRMGLAAAFLKATTTPKRNSEEEEDDDDETDVACFIPPSDDSESAPGLQALSNSLSEVALKRQQRRYRTSTPYTESDLADQVVDEDDILEWAEQVGPMFGSILPTFLHLIFFPNKPSPPSRTSFDYPQLSQDSSIFSFGSSPLLFSFSCMSAALGGEVRALKTTPVLSGESTSTDSERSCILCYLHLLQYYRLYTSASDGLSFNRLQNALLGYGGPTLLVIQSGKSTFGAFTASPWKESKDFYGNHDCFLYRLLPDTIAVYRPTGQSNNFMYCNSFARSRGYDQQAHGIGFGGTADSPRLFLAESFDDCRAERDDLTFEKGSLLGSSFGGGNSTAFEIDNLEVWAVGGTEVVQESLQARSRSRDIRQAAIQKARKVDKAAFLDDFKTGLIESKAFAHRQQIQGREGACIDDEQKKYQYEK